MRSIARVSSQHTRGRHTVALLVPALVLALLALGVVGLIAEDPRPASAAAPPVTQCNNDAASNVGGQGIACTVTIVNYVTAAGLISARAPSTVTTVRCVGAAGVISAGAGTCTTTVSVSTEPVTLVEQCNGSGNGGGGVVLCSVTVVNHFDEAPAPILAARVYQCIGSVITGPGAPGTCTPVNTPGVTSVSAATVGQCNGSGNGGTSVGFTCTVTAGSTETATLPVNINQCNGSAEGGGASTICTAGVTNVVVPVPPPAPPTPAPPAQTATPTASPTAAPTASPTATPTATPVAPTATPTPTPTPPVAPPPADTGSGGGPGDGGSGLPAAVWLAGLAAAGVLLLGARFASTRLARARADGSPR